jgi:predicted nuclease of predicted toxin-antitoxin system
LRFVVDEMFGPASAAYLRDAGHDAVHLIDAGLGGSEDAEVLAMAAAQGRAVVTENARDFIPLLDERIAAGHPVCTVIIASKKNLPRDAGAMAHDLAQRLVAWAEDHPKPHKHVYWLPHNQALQ